MHLKMKVRGLKIARLDMEDIIGILKQMDPSGHSTILSKTWTSQNSRGTMERMRRDKQECKCLNVQVPAQ